MKKVIKVIMIFCVITISDSFAQTNSTKYCFLELQKYAKNIKISHETMYLNQQDKAGFKKRDTKGLAHIEMVRKVKLLTDLEIQRLSKLINEAVTKEPLTFKKTIVQDHEEFNKKNVIRKTNNIPYSVLISTLRNRLNNIYGKRKHIF